MQLLSLHIENFGKFSGLNLRFHAGINAFRHENGYGKTTIAAFIKAMFFGLSDSRRRDLFENERSRYLPWQGGAFGGSLSFSIGDRAYRVERRFGAKPAEDSFSLVDLTSGKPSEDYSEDVGHELFGIDADGFERTVFLSERNLSGENKNQTVAEKLSDLVGTTGDVGAFDDAINRLAEKRRVLQKKGGTGDIAETQKRMDKIRLRREELDNLAVLCEAKKEELARRQKSAAQRKEEKRDLEQKSRTVLQKQQKEALYRQYTEMTVEYEAEKRRAQALDRFFAKCLPSTEQIDNERAKRAEADRLERAREGEKPKDDPVREAFRNTSPDAVARMAALAEEIDAADRQILTAEQKPPEKSRTGVLLFALGLLFLFSGAALGAGISPYFFFLCAGGMTALLLAFSERKKQSRDRALREAALTKQKAEKHGKEETLAQFLAAFPPVSADSLTGAVRIIRAQYELYCAMAKDDARREAEAEQTEEHIRTLRREASEFLALFPTESADPFAEISEKRGALDLSHRALQQMNERIARFTAANEIRESDKSPPKTETESDAAITERIAETEEQILRDEREIARLTAEIDDMTAQIESDDELREELLELEDKIADQKRQLHIIQTTDCFLKKARDRLTERYLGSTVEGFRRYVGEIGKEDGDFTMDTAFTVRKLDHGATRSTDAYSIGTRDLYALAARLALSDSLYQNETPVLIFDDPFVRFDNERLERAKEILRALAAKRQILYFTCSAERDLQLCN